MFRVKPSDNTFDKIREDYTVTKILQLKVDDEKKAWKDYPRVEHIESFSDFIILVYEKATFFDVFKKNGKLFERKHVSGDSQQRIKVENISAVILPRLEWSDRYMDMMQQSANDLGQKLVITGMASQLGNEEKRPYLMLYKRKTSSASVIKLI